MSQQYTNPAHFRQLLRNILKSTLPAMAVAATMSIGCGTPSSNSVSCPVPPQTSKTNCEESSDSHAGSHRVFVVKSVPSKERCISLCRQHVREACRTNNDPGIPNYATAVSLCETTNTQDGRTELRCEYTVTRRCAVAGRRPNGLQESTEAKVEMQPQPDSPLAEVGEFFAELAYLEQAAVTAFDYLARELEAYGAPPALIEIARRGVQEEIEHAEMMTELAATYGAKPRPVEVEPFVLRPLHEIAFENAKEGCLREAYGAMMAAWQAERAESPAVRAVMARISHEESAHAALSLAIDAWIKPQLSAEQRATYHALYEASLAELQQELAEPVSSALVQHAGYPTPAQGQAMFRALQQEITLA